jgi:hypothetical protein
VPKSYLKKAYEVNEDGQDLKSYGRRNKEGVLFARGEPHIGGVFTTHI